MYEYTDEKMNMMKTNDALTRWLDENHKGKWARHNSTFDTIEWNDGVTPPAESTYNAVKDTYENKIRYSYLREYPGIADQLDMIFHDIDNDALDKTGTFYTAIKAAKDEVPK